MGEQHITGSEFIMLIVAGLLLPLLIVICVQLRIYSNNRVPILHWCFSSLLMLIVTPIFGVFIWSFIPIVTVGWLQFIFWFQSNALTNFLGFVPIAPMLLSVILVSIPVTLWQVSRHGNA
jgi:hypothetical protein